MSEQKAQANAEGDFLLNGEEAPKTIWLLSDGNEIVWANHEVGEPEEVKYVRADLVPASTAGGFRPNAWHKPSMDDVIAQYESEDKMSGPTDVHVGEFHWRDGLFFYRFDNGDVRIRRWRDGAWEQIALIPPNEWDSIQNELSFDAIHRRPAGDPVAT